MSHSVHTDTLPVIHANAAGLDVHKMQVTATVRLARPDAQAETRTRRFSALPSGLGELTRWLLDHQVSAALMAATGVDWEVVFEALEGAGIEPLLVHAQHVKQLKGCKTDSADSVWLARLCPGNNESAGKTRNGRTRKGNSALRSLLIECAHGAARTHPCQCQGYHKALTVRRGYKRATVATAHKLLRIIYRMLASGTVYRDPDTDYEALMVKRNAPRWVAMLKKHGIDPATWSKTTQAA